MAFERVFITISQHKGKLGIIEIPENVTLILRDYDEPEIDEECPFLLDKDNYRYVTKILK